MSKFLWLILMPLSVLATSNQGKEIEEEKGDNYTFLVVGGYRPTEHVLSKYIVSLRMGRSLKFFGDNHYCGGSIIYPKVILTAAHCAMTQKNEKFKDVTAVAGSPFSMKLGTSTRVYTVIKILVNPIFSFANMRGDFALLYLDKEVEQDGQTISTVPLADEKPKPGMECITFGWGRIFPKGPRPDELVYVNMSLMKRSQCSGFYRMNPSVICAGNKMHPEKGVWKGDSGGPLLCNGKLTGVVSFGYNFELAYNYFANVYEHRNWIIANSASKFNFQLVPIPIFIHFVSSKFFSLKMFI